MGGYARHDLEKPRDQSVTKSGKNIFYVGAVPIFAYIRPKGGPINSKRDELPNDHKDEAQQGEDRREFLLRAALTAAGISVASISLQASTESNAAVPLKKPISWRLLTSDTKKEGAVTDKTAVVELTGSNGARHVVDSSSKRVEHEGGYLVIGFMKIDQYAGPSDPNPAHSETRTVIVSTKFGAVADSVRKDEVTVKVIDEAGLKTFPPTIVKVPVPNPNLGFSHQELMDKIFTEKLGTRQASQ